MRVGSNGNAVLIDRGTHKLGKKTRTEKKVD